MYVSVGKRVYLQHFRDLCEFFILPFSLFAALFATSQINQTELQ